MSSARAAVAEIRKLQQAELSRRAQRPELALRGALMDLITSCGFQYYADHGIGEDVALLGRAIELLAMEGQIRIDTPFEAASIACAKQLEREVSAHTGSRGDLEAEDALRRTMIDIPPRILLGRVDEEAAADLVCWNEANCLTEKIGAPYRCASRISALAYFSAPDRRGIIDEMVALRGRYESSVHERDELDVIIEERVRQFLDWVNTTR